MQPVGSRECFTPATEACPAAGCGGTTVARGTRILGLFVCGLGSEGIPLRYD
jgi:hypothetical protein